MNFTHFLEIFLQRCLFHFSGPNEPKYANNNGHGAHGERTSLTLNSAKKTRLEHGSTIEYTYFQWLYRTAYTLLSLLQLITRFMLHVSKERKLSLFLWGNND